MYIRYELQYRNIKRKTSFMSKNERMRIIFIKNQMSGINKQRQPFFQKRYVSQRKKKTTFRSWIYNMCFIVEQAFSVTDENVNS